MLFSKAKNLTLTKNSANNSQKIKKNKPKKSIINIRAKRKTIAKKIRIDKKNLKKTQDDESMNIDQINVELEIHENIFQTLNEKKNTFMLNEINNDNFVISIFNIIVIYS